MLLATIFVRLEWWDGIMGVWKRINGLNRTKVENHGSKLTAGFSALWVFNPGTSSICQRLRLTCSYNTFAPLRPVCTHSLTSHDLIGLMFVWFTPQFCSECFLREKTYGGLVSILNSRISYMELV